MIRFGLTILMLMLCLTTAINPAAGETYSWTDSNGVIHFSDEEHKKAGKTRKLDLPDSNAGNDYSGFIGKWSNKVSSMAFFNLFINRDHTCEAQIIQNKIYGTWLGLDDGRVEIRLRVQEDDRINRRGQLQIMKLVVKYDPSKGCLLVKLDNEDKVTMLYRVND